MNEGYITNLPAECVVEIPAYVDANGISVPVVGELPLGPAAVCSQSAWVQRIAVEAAVNGDVKLLIQAMMLDPLTGAVCNTKEICQMVDEYLVEQAKWLPQYADSIDDARKRLEDAKANGTFIDAKRNYKGAARKKEKTLEEIAQESRTLNVR
jgi:alpha-galactosidase